MGVGVNDMDASLKFYRKFFGMDVAFFDAVAPAPLMDIYTRNSTITKRASMILNLQGGGAMEVIRPTSFEPAAPKFEVLPGDLGIFAVQIRTSDIHESHAYCLMNKAPGLSEISFDPNGKPTFFMNDPDHNVFQFVEDTHNYMQTGQHSGGVFSCSIGVKDIEKSRKLYSDLLGYDKVLYDKSDKTYDASESWKDVAVRRVMLTQSAPAGGGFAKVMGQTGIELVQALDRSPNPLFQDRIWADNGFVHLGFDVKGMTLLGQEFKDEGFGFTCDSNDALDMGSTKVHCTYIEDVNGTWLELIEVFKVPIIEKWGVFLNVEKRDPLKPLPDFMLKALRFSRIKD